MIITYLYNLCVKLILSLYLNVITFYFFITLPFHWYELRSPMSAVITT